MSGKKRGLRSWVLLILNESPKTGAEVMDEMERMSSGWWRPSPGSVYPLLEEMTREGITRRNDDGRYELVGSVREQFGWRFPTRSPRNPGEVVQEIASLVAYLEDLRRSDATQLAEAKPSIQAAADRLRKLAN